VRTSPIRAKRDWYLGRVRGAGSDRDRVDLAGTCEPGLEKWMTIMSAQDAAGDRVREVVRVALDEFDGSVDMRCTRAVFSFPWATAGLPQRFLALSRTPVLLFRLRQNQLMRRSVLGRSLIAAVWCLGLLSAGNGFAGWQVTQTERLNAPSGLEFVRHTVVSGSKRAELHVVRFDSKRMTLAVMDNPEGALNLGSASLKRGAFAAVNGGYFHPDGTPLGLVVWQGREVHPLERARLGRFWWMPGNR
jgi:hypothetical protein